MILLFILGVSLIQFAVYILNNKLNTDFPSLVILLTLLLCYFFVFPRFFFPEPIEDEINCGMPALGVTLGFWIFGTIAGIATHLVWFVIKKLAAKNRKQKSHSI